MTPVTRVAGAADPDLVRRVLRLAVTAIDPGVVVRVLSGLLERGWDGAVEVLLVALERRAAPLAGDADVAGAEAALHAHGAVVLVVGQRGYPARLAAAWPELGAPPWLFGRLPPAGLPDGPAVAIVGTRQPTADGIATAEALGRHCARHGVAVVSGMARGIDQAAHRGALDAAGRTVGVLGTGLGVDYPARAAPLRAAVADAGGLVTEHLPGVGARPVHFLWRNRIISGLADATVVVEGRRRSGALQTARLAAGQGREVLAVPGSINQPTSRGPLDLIRDGARPVTRLDDVLEAIGVEVRGEPVAAPAPDLEPAAARVLDLLGAAPAPADVIAARARLPVRAVLVALADLETHRLARMTPRGAVRLNTAG